MGVDAGDFDNDGDADLLVTELTGQGSDLYVNDGRVFSSSKCRSDCAISVFLYRIRPAWFDFDNDGWLDTLSVNSRDGIQGLRANDPFPLHQNSY